MKFENHKIITKLECLSQFETLESTIFAKMKIE